MPTMVQFYEPPKGARGGRLGSAPAFAGVTTQFGYSSPAANINVSPTFSNIGNPNVNVAGRDMYSGGKGSDIFGGPGADTIDTRITPAGGGRTPSPTPLGPGPTTPTPTPTPTPTAPDTSKGSKLRAKTKAAAKALTRQQSKGEGEKIVKSEMQKVIQNKGIRAVRRAVNKGEFNVGGGAKKFLDRKVAQLRERNKRR